MKHKGWINTRVIQNEAHCKALLFMVSPSNYCQLPVHHNCLSIGLVLDLTQVLLVEIEHFFVWLHCLPWLAHWRSGGALQLNVHEGVPCYTYFHVFLHRQFIRSWLYHLRETLPTISRHADCTRQDSAERFDKYTLRRLSPSNEKVAAHDSSNSCFWKQDRRLQDLLSARWQTGTRLVIMSSPKLLAKTFTTSLSSLPDLLQLSL
jgi:hypothetical protein